MNQSHAHTYICYTYIYVTHTYIFIIYIHIYVCNLRNPWKKTIKKNQTEGLPGLCHEHCLMVIFTVRKLLHISVCEGQ